MKLSMTAHIHAQRQYDGQITFSAIACDMSEYGYTKLFEREVEIDVDIPDDFDLTEKEIEALQRKKKRVQADAQLEITRIEEQIQSLQAIEFKG